MDVQDTEKFNLWMCKTPKSQTKQFAGHRRVRLSGLQDTQESDLAVCRTQKSQT